MPIIRKVDRKRKEGKLLSMLKHLRDTKLGNQKWNTQEFIGLLAEYETEKEIYLNIMKGSDREPLDFEKKLQVEVINHSLRILPTNEELLRKIRDMEETVVANENVMIIHEQGRNERIKQLEQQKKELEEKLKKKPIIIYRDSEVFHKSASPKDNTNLTLPPKNPGSTDNSNSKILEKTEQEKKIQILREKCKNIREKYEEKSNPVEIKKYNVEYHQQRIENEIRMRYVVKKDEFEDMYNEFC